MSVLRGTGCGFFAACCRRVTAEGFVPPLAGASPRSGTWSLPDHRLQPVRRRLDRCAIRRHVSRRRVVGHCVVGHWSYRTIGLRYRLRCRRKTLKIWRRLLVSPRGFADRAVRSPRRHVADGIFEDRPGVGGLADFFQPVRLHGVTALACSASLGHIDPTETWPSG
jgi:hypothetical protein